MQSPGELRPTAADTQNVELLSVAPRGSRSPCPDLFVESLSGEEACFRDEAGEVVEPVAWEYLGDTEDGPLHGPSASSGATVETVDAFPSLEPIHNSQNPKNRRRVQEAQTFQKTMHLSAQEARVRQLLQSSDGRATRRNM